jgi:two-component system, LytTR family, sensor kinase
MAEFVNPLNTPVNQGIEYTHVNYGPFNQSVEYICRSVKTKKMGRQKIWPHLLLWFILYLLWVIVFQRRAFTFIHTVTVEFCYLFFVAANFYFNIKYAIPHFLYQRKYMEYAALFLGGILAGALLRVPLAMFLNKYYFLPSGQSPSPKELFINSLTNIFIWVLVLVAGKLIYDRIRFQQYVQDIEKEKSKTELDFLKAQFNPHFLFNSINSIYGHIDKNNTSARNMLLTFSEMLRYQLYECNTESIPIEKELNYIKNYSLLQQSRKEENLVVRLNAADNIKGFVIAPLLFIAFIENCFKYAGENEKGESKVEIELQKINDTLCFRVFNTKDNSRPSSIEHKGIGIANVKRRLDLLYPDRYELNIDDRETSHEVTLKLQLS